MGSLLDYSVEACLDNTLLERAKTIDRSLDDKSNFVALFEITDKDKEKDERLLETIQLEESLGISDKIDSCVVGICVYDPNKAIKLINETLSTTYKPEDISDIVHNYLDGMADALRQYLIDTCESKKIKTDAKKMRALLDSMVIKREGKQFVFEKEEKENVTVTPKPKVSLLRRLRNIFKK